MYLPRGLQPKLKDRLESDPVVILEGARAVGKTRLVDHAIEAGWLTGKRSFLDPAELDAARAAPRDYIANLPHGIAIDEAQLCEAILLPIKEVAERAGPGGLLLTGSTRLRRNQLGGSDPLAGRVGSPLHLGPLTLGEREGQPIQVVSQLFDGDPKDFGVGISANRSDLVELVRQVGMPGLVVKNDTQKDDWARAYIDQVTGLSNFESLDIQRVNQLARFLAGRTSTLVNINDFAREVEFARPTVEKYLARLEEALIIHRLRGWRRSKDKSETNRPKIHFFDAGVACAVARMQPRTQSQDLGRLVETLVVTELIKQSRWMPAPPDCYHWRRSQRHEVDLILEATDDRAVCIEVKTAERVQASDFSGIDEFRGQHPDSFHRGFVFYSGTRVLPFGDNRWALPIAMLRNTRERDTTNAPTASETPQPSIDDIARAVNERRRGHKPDGAPPGLQFLQEAERQLRKLGQSIDGFETDVQTVGNAVVLSASKVQSPAGESHPLLVIRVEPESRVEAAVKHDEVDAWDYRPSVQVIDRRDPAAIITSSIEGTLDDLVSELNRRDHGHG